MRMRKWSGPAVLALMVFSLVGCATSQNVASGAALNTQIQIDNNLSGIQGVTAWLVTDSGNRRQLGPIDSNRRATYDRSLRAGTYYLLATRVNGEDIASERFRLDTDGIVVVWDMRANQITFQQR